MSSAPTANATPQPHEPSPVAAFLSLLIPGLGQIYQGRFGKGILFMVSLLGMFFLGQAMGNWQNVYVPRPDGRNDIPGEVRTLPSSLLTRWHYIGQFWIGVAAWPALGQYFRTPPPPVFDGEPAPFWETYQRTPDEVEVNRFLVNRDKTPDLGWVYTVVAGMLNILVIYDAYAGPVFIPALRLGNRSLLPQSEAKQQGGA